MKKTYLDDKVIGIVKTLKTIRDVIDNGYSAPNICAKTLSKRFNVNYKFLIREFKELYNEPIHKRINRLRVEKAKEWLKTEHWRLNRTIYESLGFHSHTNFYCVFKEATGMSPSEYRMKYQVQAIKNES